MLRPISTTQQLAFADTRVLARTPPNDALDGNESICTRDPALANDCPIHACEAKMDRNAKSTAQNGH